CKLQHAIGHGQHRVVRVSGSVGPALIPCILQDSECGSDATWVEFAPSANENKEKLRLILEKTRRAHVELVGEFYGPGEASPRLPEAVRESYHPGWGHLSGYATKLVVQDIRSVEAIGGE